MLSVEEPPNTSCSCKISDPRGDETAAQKLALQEAPRLDYKLEHKHHFSIRDSVFSARSKDIQVNWPFPQQYLQLCLNHGVEDLLPPFEHPELVRARSSRKVSEFNQLKAHVDSASEDVDLVKEEDVGLSNLEPRDYKLETGQRFDQTDIESKDCAQFPASEGEVGFTAADSHDKKLCEVLKALGSNNIGGENAPEGPPEVVKPTQTSKRSQISCEPSGRKCRLIVKLGVNQDSNRAEENILNSTAASESMGSKTCPVCKTFSSTSNTTLNAHIDQCLSNESTSMRAVAKLTKQNMKPRKKKLMVDIYATAPYCTLEDLDKRNGTNWAIDSILPPNSEILAESKRRRLNQISYNDDVEESAVYVDSNGRKLRIISKLNDVLVPTAVKNSKPRKRIKDSKLGKSSLISKKKCVAKSSENLKFKSQSKKPCTRKLYRDKIHEAVDGQGHVENHEREECLSQLLKSRDALKGISCGTLRQWACSKRTCLSKKLNETDSHGDANGFVSQKPFIRRNRSTLVNSLLEKSHSHKLLELSEDSNASLGIQSTTCNFTDDRLNSEKSSFSQLIGGSSSVADDRTLKNTRSLENCISSPGGGKVEIDATTTQTSLKLCDVLLMAKAKKHATLKSAVLGKPSLLMEEKTAVGYVKHPRRRRNEKRSIFKKSLKGRCMVEMREWDGELPFDADKGYHNINNICPSKSNNQESPAEEFTVSADTGITYSAEKAGRDQSRSTHDDQSDSYLSLEEHEGPVSETEVWIERAAPILCDDQEVNCAGVGDERDTSSQTTGDVNSFVGVDSFSNNQFMECLTCPSPIQGPENPGLESFWENYSSVTSSGHHLLKDPDDPLNRDTSASPISDNSTISPPPIGFPDLKYSEQVSLNNGRKPSFMDAMDVALSCSLPPVQRNKSEILPEKESAKVSDYEPGCCSPKESNYPGPTQRYQDSTNLKLMSSNENNRLGICNSLMICQDLRTYETVAPAFGMLMDPICSKYLDDVVKSPSCSELGLAGSCSQTQTTSIPMLRLMGQNLMIANNGEDESVLLGRVPPASAENDQPNGNYSVPHGFSMGNVSSRDIHPLYHESSDGAVNVDQEVCNRLQNFDLGSSNSFRNCSNSSMPLPSLELRSNHRDLHLGAFVGSDLQQGSKGTSYMQNYQTGPNRKDLSQFACIEKMVPYYQCQKSVSASHVANPLREVIVIEDSPDIVIDSRAIDRKCPMKLGKSHLPLVGVPVQASSQLGSGKELCCSPSQNSFREGAKNKYTELNIKFKFC